MPPLTRRRALASGLAWAAGLAATRAVHAAQQRGLDQFLLAEPSCKDDKLTPAVAPDPPFRPDAPARMSLLEPGVGGQRVVVSGFVIGLTCGRIKAARVDFWQADSSGAFDRTGARLRGRQTTDAQGRYRLETVLPGPTPGRARRLSARVEPPGKPALVTELFFPDDPGNARDKLFKPALAMRPVAGSPGTFAFDFVFDSVTVRAVLSDLDDTLFDHAHAARQALAALHAEVPHFQRWPGSVLESRHGIALELMHGEVLAGRMTIEAARTERFRRLLDEAAPGGVASAEIAADLARRYRGAYERAWRPVAGALALAAAVKQAGLVLVIVTNNVTSEQRLKLDRCGLAPHVDALVTSEAVGATKPDARIFEAALARAGVWASEAVMIGDAWHTDVAGALAVGVRAVWLNHAGVAAPHPAPVAEVRSLEPLAEVWRALVPAP